MEKKYSSDFAKSGSLFQSTQNLCTNGEPGSKTCKDQNKVKKAAVTNSQISQQSQRITKKRATLTPTNKHNATKSGFRVHLKTEEGDFKNESIEFTPTIPRVAVRMEYLMHSTKVRLNDREFMDSLYTKLLAEEAKSLVKSTEVREFNEQNRVKKLVIEGKMPPPEDMQDLFNHPVFRVNAMLKRLENHDHSLMINKLKSNITPVEPYEFDGNTFFKQLHENGTYWVPEVERIAEEEKLAGKIARAKLRLLDKRRKQSEQEKMLRLVYLNNSQFGEELDTESQNENGDEEEDEDPVEREKRRRKRRISKIKEQLTKEAEIRAARFKLKKERLHEIERRRKEKFHKRKTQRDVIFMEDREKENKRLVDMYKQRMIGKNLLNFSISKSETIDEKRKPRMFDYEGIFDVPSTPSSLEEDDSFTHLRKAFDISGGYKLNKYQISTNPVIQKYLDVVKNVDELFTNAKDVNQMYTREDKHAKKFIATHNLMR